MTPSQQSLVEQAPTVIQCIQLYLGDGQIIEYGTE